MHTEIEYTGTTEEKDAAALRDVKEYLGSRYREIMRDIRGAAYHEGLTEKDLRCMLGIAGIQGYPVGAVWRKYGAPYSK